ncbi:hypothetical protein Tco_0448549 [Tanacetum coccineum]
MLRRGDRGLEMLGTGLGILGRSSRGSPRDSIDDRGRGQHRVVELSELHEMDKHDMNALQEDAQIVGLVITAVRYERRKRVIYLWGIGDSPGDRMDGGGVGLCLPARHNEARDELTCSMSILALREQRRTAGQSGPEARIPDHQEASGDADSHI